MMEGVLFLQDQYVESKSRPLQLIQSSDGGDDALPTTAFFPTIFDDLQINVLSGAFLSEEHGGLLAVLSVATM